MVIFPDDGWRSETIWRRSGSQNIHLDTGQPERGEERDLRGESDGSPQQDSSLDDGEARNVFWSMSVDSLYRHHVEPRVKLYMLKEESFPIPLKYIGVTSRSPTTVMTANSEVLTREGGDDICQTIGLIRQCYVSSRKSRSAFMGETLRKNMGTRITGKAVKNHISPQSARELIAPYQTLYHS